MAKAPNTTTAQTGNIAPFGLRMLPELRNKLEDAARSSGRSMNAEIVKRLEKSFEPTPTTTEVPWDLRLERRMLDERLSTARAHMMTVVLYMASLESKLENAIQRGAGEDEVERIKALIESGAEDEQRIIAQVGELVEQSRRVEAAFNAVDREIDDRMDRTVQRALQPDYRQVHATEAKLEIPETSRTVKINPSSGDNPR